MSMSFLTQQVWSRNKAHSLAALPWQGCSSFLAPASLPFYQPVCMRIMAYTLCIHTTAKSCDWHAYDQLIHTNQVQIVRDISGSMLQKDQ